MKSRFLGLPRVSGKRCSPYTSILSSSTGISTSSRGGRLRSTFPRGKRFEVDVPEASDGSIMLHQLPLSPRTIRPATRRPNPPEHPKHLLKEKERARLPRDKPTFDNKALQLKGCSFLDRFQQFIYSSNLSHLLNGNALSLRTGVKPYHRYDEGFKSRSVPWL